MKLTKKNVPNPLRRENKIILGARGRNIESSNTDTTADDKNC